MIEIRFKECCHVCTHVKTDVQEQSMYSADGRVVERGVVVKCEHEAVCGEYQKYLRTEGC